MHTRIAASILLRASSMSLPSHLTMFELLTRERPPDAPLWPEAPLQAARDFNDACTLLALDALKPCRYALRRGGASEDRQEEQNDGHGSSKLHAAVSQDHEPIAPHL